MCWVLDGVLSCACVREHVRVRAMRVCVLGVCSFVCLFSFVRVCAAFVRACPCVACMRACVSANACVCAFPSDCIFALVCVCVAATCGITSSARAARRRRRARGWAWCHRPGSRASAAGVNWTSRTLVAQWAARDAHTSVLDAAGAIYVIGGGGDIGYYADVWASTDSGARGGRGVLGGHSMGVLRVLHG